MLNDREDKMFVYQPSKFEGQLVDLPSFSLSPSAADGWENFFRPLQGNKQKSTQAKKKKLISYCLLTLARKMNESIVMVYGRHEATSNNASMLGAAFYCRNKNRQDLILMGYDEGDVFFQKEVVSM